MTPPPFVKLFRKIDFFLKWWLPLQIIERKQARGGFLYKLKSRFLKKAQAVFSYELAVLSVVCCAFWYIQSRFDILIVNFNAWYFKQISKLKIGFLKEKIFLLFLSLVIFSWNACNSCIWWIFYTQLRQFRYANLPLQKGLHLMSIKG